MKATKMTLMAALAAGCLLTLTPALRADNTTSKSPAGDPPAGSVHGPGMRGHMNFNRLARQLHLSTHQKSKVKAIFENQRGKMRKLRQDQNLSRKDRWAKMKAIHKNTLAKLKAVLTVDQFNKFQEMRPKRNGLQHGRRGGPPPQS